jgi:hypothetical protein
MSIGFLSGCATERLRDNTVAVSASSTDIYYQMVLENVARAHVEHHVLPWAIQLSSSQIAVNYTDQLQGGYSETWPMVTPSANFQGTGVLQQNWTISPVMNHLALLELQTLYDKAGAEKGDFVTNAPPIGITQFQTQTQWTNAPPPTGTYTTSTVSKTTTTVTSSKDTSLFKSNDDPVWTSDGSVLGPNKADSRPLPDVPYIDTSCFHFCGRGLAPLKSYHADYGQTTAYVLKNPGDIDNFTRFTLLVLSVVNQGNTKLSSGGGSANKSSDSGAQRTLGVPGSPALY